MFALGKSLVLVSPLLLALSFNNINLEQLPIRRLVRNLFLSGTPEEVTPIHTNCSFDNLGKDVTIVVSVKDSCSQGPGFLKALEDVAPPSVRVIYTYPNFTSCAALDFSESQKYWDTLDMVPLNIHVSPMQGWLDAVNGDITTKYTYLVHNDGYALEGKKDKMFLCELVQGLKDKQADHPEFSVAAPMLYESKADGTFASHATQSNLRLVRDNWDWKTMDYQGEYPDQVTIRHDHSASLALRRQKEDLQEEEQTEFLEDHGFVAQTDRISRMIDPDASFTMEYLDMILSIRSNGWKVLFVPTARLEFRVTEFSWRDLAYFMYKRSEVTAHSTRDYLKAKWKVNFPNTGFWTFIKYTIVEQHRYEHKDGKLVSTSMKGVTEEPEISAKDQALVALGFFQMVGWNKYKLADNSDYLSFLDVLEKFDNGYTTDIEIKAVRNKTRAAWQPENVQSTVKSVEDVLDYGGYKFPTIEADMPLEYLPYAAAELRLNTCDEATGKLRDVCGLLLQHQDYCSCWINLPSFKKNNWVSWVVDMAASYAKIPSRVATYYEMITMPEDKAHLDRHLSALSRFEANPNFSLHRCPVQDPECAVSFRLTSKTKLVQFVGAPVSPDQVEAALREFGLQYAKKDVENAMLKQAEAQISSLTVEKENLEQKVAALQAEASQQSQEIVQVKEALKDKTANLERVEASYKASANSHAQCQEQLSKEQKKKASGDSKKNSKKNTKQ
eukprot:m.57354 g.57354  ORF g.57354 m.57354 type:complete len:726 (-) comp11102_c0_seq1:115-2292(-)